jgi:hypothetical protein
MCCILTEKKSYFVLCSTLLLKYMKLGSMSNMIQCNHTHDDKSGGAQVL